MKKTTTVFILIVVLMSIAIASDADNGASTLNSAKPKCTFCYLKTCWICINSSSSKTAAYDETAYATAGTPSPSASPGN